ncbi:MAG: hypothetical protein WD738_17205 [Pirellulales bacterium]
MRRSEGNHCDRKSWGFVQRVATRAEDVEDELDPERASSSGRNQETEATAEIFRDLRVEKSLHPVAPLFKGK